MKYAHALESLIKCYFQVSYCDFVQLTALLSKLTKHRFDYCYVALKLPPYSDPSMPTYSNDARGGATTCTVTNKEAAHRRLNQISCDGESDF